MRSSVVSGYTSAAAKGAALGVAREGTQRLTSVAGRPSPSLAAIAGVVLLFVAYKVVMGGKRHAV
jgi:hypothetical protein